MQGNQAEHIKNNNHLIGKRNKHGQFTANEPIFSEIKFRFYNKNTRTTRIYNLATLIGTTFRRGQFEFRGRWTGLLDKYGKEIFAADFNIRYNGYKYGVEGDTNSTILDSGIVLNNTIVNLKPTISTYLFDNRFKAK